MFAGKKGYQEPYWLHRNESYTHGIGGQAKVIGEAKVPIGIGGAQGSMTMRVMEDGAPPLIPMHVMDRLGMELSARDNKIFWRGLNTSSNVTCLPSGHRTISVTDYQTPATRQAGLATGAEEPWEPMGGNLSGTALC